MSHRWIKAAFIVSGIYDLVLGGVMFFASPQVFQWAGITGPDPGYVQFPALLVALFGLMFLQIGAGPAARREMIPYGIGLKAAYCGVVFWYQMKGTAPAMWLPLAWIDFVFLILFVIAWRKLAPKAAQA